MTKLVPVYHVTTFVPPANVAALIEGVLAIASLDYGAYDRVAWWSAPGIEQFRPLQGSNPTLGRAGLLEQKSSVLVHFSIPRDRDLLDKVLAEALIPNHPWEEPVVYVNESLATRADAA